MAFSGGTFSRTFDCTTDRDNGVKILASKFDTELDGMATGLSTCILKDGTQTCTAAIPFAEGLTVPDNKTIVLGTNSDITIQYDESTNDSLEIAANVEGAALGIVLKADQGDDNADQHKVNIADGGTLTMASKISGSFVSYLTHTPNSTVASSTTAVAGNLTVGGDLTLGSGAVISEAELEAIDGVTAGTVTASKAVIVDSNKDIASFRNITLTGELDAGSLDVSGDADIDGTLEADAMTLNGTAITATATLDTGISNNNVPKFTSGVADNDFLRVDGTAIEGRSASEVLSDIAAAPAAGSSNIVTTGALNSGSITSGFGAIDNGSSAITTTGVITGGTLEATADTSAGDNAAIGYTAAEGLILTGQGSTSDITLKNDADATVFTVPTGTNDILFPDNAKAIFGAGSDLQIYHDGSHSYIDDAGTGDLIIRASDDLHIQKYTGETMINCNVDGSVDLYHNNVNKLQTTSTGVDITGGFTATAASTITTADNTTQLTLKSTDADANAGPVLDLIRDSSSPAADDDLGRIRFRGDDAAGNEHSYALIQAKIVDTTDGSEGSQLQFYISRSGTVTSAFTLHESEAVFNDGGLDADFRVETNAQTNAFFVDSGNELISMTVPLTITTADNDPQLTLVSTDADATQGPVLKFYRNSASPADNDLIGQLLFHGEDGAGNDQQYANIQSIITNNAHGNESSSLNISTIKGGSVEQSVKFGATETVFNESSLDLDFRVESDGNANMFFVNAGTGRVGIMTNDPQARLDVHDSGGSSNNQLCEIHSDSSTFSTQMLSLLAERNTTNSTFNVIRYRNTGASANRFFVRDSGNVENTNNSYGAVSDESLKKNITDAASQWDDIKALTVRKFHFNEQADDDPKLLGLVAQEVEKISAGLVSTAYDEEEEKDIKSVKYSVLYMKAVKALQEAMTRIETLEAKVTALEAG
jgi:cytoskeletal protein CcmA (bactofilin family)